MDALEAFELTKGQAHDYLAKLRHRGYPYGPDDKESYFIDGYRRAMDADGEPYHPTTWMFCIDKPQKGDAVVRFAALPYDPLGKKLRPVIDCWERHECAPEDLPRRVIEEIRSLIALSGGWTPDVMRP